MRRISTLASVVALVLSTGAGPRAQSEPAGSAAQVALDEYFRAWNAGDNEAIAAASNFPRLSIGRNGQVVVREGPAEIEIDFDLLRQVEGWHHTTLDLVEVVQVSDDKVHFKILSSRRRQDETTYRTTPALYVVTNQNGHWGLQLQSILPATFSAQP
jgi:hypothetical protein